MSINLFNFQPPSTNASPAFNPDFTFQAAGCLPVNIYDANGTLLAVVAAGSSYTTSPQTFTRTITFKAGSSNAVSFVSIGTGIIRVASSTNISSATYYNRTTLTSLTPPYSVNINDVININVTPTNSAIDSVLILEGQFTSVTVSVMDPNLGFDGVEGYILNEPDKTLTIFDTTTDLVITTVTLDAASTHTSAVYRGIDDSYYVFGFSGVNTLTLQKVNAVTNVAGAMTSYAATNIGFTPVCCGYSYLQDKFILVSGGGAATPVVVFDPVTLTLNATSMIDIVAATSVQIMGYADDLEDSFFVCGGASSTSNCYKYLSATKFQVKASIVRVGAASVTFNTTNRYFYTTDTNGAPRWYSTNSVPEIGFASGTNCMRRSGICFDPVNNKIFGTDIVSRQYGMFDVGSVTMTAFAPAAVGAETAYRCCEFNAKTGKVYISTRNGNLVRSINTTTGAIINTIVVGNQHTGTAGSLNQLGFRKVKL